jgi:putative NIF3 family GTP cyclohydrolase 1 type 2
MQLKNIYQEIIAQGIVADIRSEKEINRLLKERKQQYEKLSLKEKEFFDQESLVNPFADTRILCGDLAAEIKSMIVGIDVDGAELLLVDRLKEKKKTIDLVVSHHPEGRAYANFFEVMDLQVDAYVQEGVTVSAAENLLGERKAQVDRRVHAANWSRAVDIARYLDLNFLCMHTPCDNLAYRFLRRLFDQEKPGSLGQIMDLLMDIPEYQHAGRNNNAPKIVNGSKQSRCHRILLEFTGGTEGPQEIYKNLSQAGVDTIVAMHQSEEHFRKSKEANINVIFASHIASDNLGVNLMIDQLQKKEKIKVYEFSGFKRVIR